MRDWTEADLRCRCGATVRARIIRGAHVSRCPEVREDVLARRFHRFPCTCGATLELRSRFVYTDLARRQLVLVAPTARTEWLELEAELSAIDRVLEHGSPWTSPWVFEVRRRVVLGLEALREKLVLWEAGIDDALGECIKARAFASDLTLGAPGSRLVFDRVGDDDGLICNWHPQADYPPARQVGLPAAWLSDAQRDRASLKARFPELFGGGFVSIDRLRVAP